jgi:hypothetical protein
MEYIPYIHKGRRYISINGGAKPWARHLMEQHLGRILETWEEVHHRNDDPMDDRIDNYKVMHRSIHRMITNQKRIRMRGKENANSKVTEEQVLEMRRLYATKEYSHRRLGSMFNLTHSVVGDIISRTTWNHV